MVARPRTGLKGFIVTFHRDGEPPEATPARDGVSAWRHAVNMLAKRDALRDGDKLTVTAAGEVGLINRRITCRTTKTTRRNIG
jgi:hypothetical protein